jgi:hypothetical protein
MSAPAWPQAFSIVMDDIAPLLSAPASTGDDLAGKPGWADIKLFPCQLGTNSPD